MACLHSDALYLVASAIVDTLHSLVALETRLTATAVDLTATAGVATFAAAKTGASAVKGYFSAEPADASASGTVTVEDDMEEDEEDTAAQSAMPAR